MFGESRVMYPGAVRAGVVPAYRPGERVVVVMHGPGVSSDRVAVVQGAGPDYVAVRPVNESFTVVCTFDGWLEGGDYVLGRLCDVEGVSV